MQCTQLVLHSYPIGWCVFSGGAGAHIMFQSQTARSARRETRARISVQDALVGSWADRPLVDIELILPLHILIIRLQLLGFAKERGKLCDGPQGLLNCIPLATPAISATQAPR